MKQNLLSVEELSQILNVPKSWVYARIRETGSNAMPKVRVGKYCRFFLDEVLKWLRDKNGVAH